MIWLALHLRGFLSAGWDFARRNPLLALCAILAALSAYSWHGWNVSEAKRKADAVAFQTASDQAKTAQAALRAKEEANYVEQAHKADAHFAAVRADGRAGTDRFIADHRVQPQGDCRPAIAFRETDPAGQPEAVPSTAVMVDEADVRRAAEWQSYAIALHDWAVSVSR
jgi:hypothetical protein